MIKQGIKKIIGALGVEVKKKQPVIKLSESECFSAGYIVEFVGSPGVGKTTLFEHVIGDEQHACWYARNQIKTYIETYKPHTFSLLKDSHERCISELLHKKSNNLLRDNNDPLSKSVGLFNYFLKQLEMDIYATFCEDLPKGLMSDEGVVQNFTEEILDMTSHDDFVYHDVFHALMENRIIIYMIDSTENITKKLHKRNRPARDGAKFHEQKNIEEKIDKTKREKENMVSIAQQYGATVLKIDAAEDLEMNCNTVSEFINFQSNAGKVAVG